MTMGAREEVNADRGKNSKRAVAGRKHSKEETVGFLLWDAERLHRRFFQKRVARHGITWGHVPILRELWEADGLAVGELAARTHMSVPHIVVTIRTFESLGLATRVPNLDDQRKVNVFLTDKGREFFRVVLPDIRIVNDIADAGFEPVDIENLKSLLRRMRRNLGTA